MLDFQIVSTSNICVVGILGLHRCLVSTYTSELFGPRDLKELSSIYWATKESCCQSYRGWPVGKLPWLPLLLYRYVYSFKYFFGVSIARSYFRVFFLGPLAEKIFKGWDFQKEPANMDVADLLQEILMCFHRAIIAEGGVEGDDCRTELLLVGKATSETIDISETIRCIQSRHDMSDASSVIKDKINSILTSSCFH